MVTLGLTVLLPLSPVRSPARAADILIPDSPQDVPTGGTLGSVAATAQGDLQGATPGPALRRRANRLLETPLGGYAHLPTFGARLARDALATPSSLALSQLEAERTLRSDPDIVDAEVVVQSRPRGATRAVMQSVRIQDRFGGVDSFLAPGDGR
jgi:hypothetical protein